MAARIRFVAAGFGAFDDASSGKRSVKVVESSCIFFDQLGLVFSPADWLTAGTVMKQHPKTKANKRIDFMSFFLSEHPALGVVFAAVLWSSSGAFAKLIALPGPVMAFYRTLFAAVLLILILWHRVRKGTVRLEWRAACVPMFLSFFVMNVAYVSAITFTSAANAIFLQYTAPIWMVVASVYVLKEPVDTSSLKSLALGALGIGLLISGSVSAEPLGVWLGLLSGVAFGLLSVFLRVLRDLNATWLTFLNHLMACVLLLPFLSIFPAMGSLFEVSPAQLLGLAAFGMLQMAFPYWLYSQSLKRMSAQEVGVLGLLEPTLNPVVTFCAVGEVPRWQTLAGGALILVGIAMRYFPSGYLLRKTVGKNPTSGVGK